jgi:Family of unknown function (DUF6416)
VIESWTTVQVMLPQSRLGEFHEMFGRWLQSQPKSLATEPDSAMPPASVGAVLSRASWSEGSDERLLRDAERVYRGLSRGARQNLDYLLDHPGYQATATELGRELGLGSPNGVAGTLASFGFQCKAVKRGLPFDWLPAPDGATTYRMDQDVVDLFRSAREQVRRNDGSVRRPAGGAALMP